MEIMKLAFPIIGRFSQRWSILADVFETFSATNISARLDQTLTNEQKYLQVKAVEENVGV